MKLLVSPELSGVLTDVTINYSGVFTSHCWLLVTNMNLKASQSQEAKNENVYVVSHPPMKASITKSFGKSTYTYPPESVAITFYSGVKSNVNVLGYLAVFVVVVMDYNDIPSGANYGMIPLIL